MKLSSPLPQTLPKECQKAAKIFKSFVDSGNNGLDGVIPRNILENAKGLAIFTIFKAGFVFSARAGSGIVIAKLDDGTWSAPSAIGTAGLGVGGQAGAEMTDFLIVLNSRSAVKSFMASGSLTLGGNLSIAVGPLGRNGEAIGSVNSSGKLAAMYSYSKTRGLFGGVSVEGSVIVERQDANAVAYKSDVTAKMLLSGAVEPPEWASPLIKTLEACTGLPGNRKWVQEFDARHSDDYIFSAVESPSYENGSASRLKKKDKERPDFVRRTSSSSYFDFRDRSQDNLALTPPLSKTPPVSKARYASGKTSTEYERPTTEYFSTKFESDFVPEEQLRKHPKLKLSPDATRQTFVDSPKTLDPNEWEPGSPFNSLPPFSTARSQMTGWDATSHRRSISAYTPLPVKPKLHSYSRSVSRKDPYEEHSSSVDYLEDLDGNPPSHFETSQPMPKLKPKTDFSRPLPLAEGVAQAIALYDFNAVQSGDLSFKKGQVIVVKEMSNSTDTWWKGKLDGREGVFPANFVEVV